MELRKATTDDISRILEITDSARQYQRSQGFTQWEDGYPSRRVIEMDIESGCACVLVDGNTIAAYAVLAVGDKDYDLLDDTWLFDGRYGVIHRIAIAPEMRGRHLSATIFNLFETKYISSDIGIIRIDTGLENKIMHHLMSKLGYECRGIRKFSWGERLAYEKRLKQ